MLASLFGLARFETTYTFLVMVPFFPDFTSDKLGLSNCTSSELDKQYTPEGMMRRFWLSGLKTLFVELLSMLWKYTRRKGAGREPRLVGLGTGSLEAAALLEAVTLLYDTKGHRRNCSPDCIIYISPTRLRQTRNATEHKTHLYRDLTYTLTTASSHRSGCQSGDLSLRVKGVDRNRVNRETSEPNSTRATIITTLLWGTRRLSYTHLTYGPPIAPRESIIFHLISPRDT